VIAAALLQSMVNQPFLISWLETMLLIGLIWELMNYVTIQPGYPFSLDWSEGSWYYYASFFTSKRFYGIQINWPFLDIGRPTLLSLPFIASIRSLPFERFWQTFLWIGSSALLSLCLVRRLKIGSGIIKVLYVAFGFIWVLLGPIYFHLAISACIVLLGFNGKKPVRSLLWTLVASFWAGLMRINWIPVPAMIGATLYFLEFPWKRTTSFWNYVKRPLSLLIGGTIFGAGTFLGFALLSGRMNTMIITKVTAPFLFDRLWPNGTFQVGILPGALFLSSLLIFFIWLYGRNNLIHPLRWSALYLMLMVLFFGGVYSSLKIGGGNNLHNLDAFWAMVLIILFYTISGNVVSENESYRPVLKWPLTILLICVPILISMLSTPDVSLRNNAIAKQELAQLTRVTQQADSKGGKVLFIADRHLLTFGLIQGVHLIPEYELEELIEMAMARNLTYIDDFQTALASKEYQLIIINTVTTDLEGSEHTFSAENNSWRNYIVMPLLQYYQLVLELPQSRLQIYKPLP
jgi:hypothetical protein